MSLKQLDQFSEEQLRNSIKVLDQRDRISRMSVAGGPDGAVLWCMGIMSSVCLLIIRLN